GRCGPRREAETFVGRPCRCRLQQREKSLYRSSLIGAPYTPPITRLGASIASVAIATASLTRRLTVHHPELTSPADSPPRGSFFRSWCSSAHIYVQPFEAAN